jgi:hypothetical protein
VKVRLPYTGKWRIYASHGDSGHYTTTSGYKSVTVK